MYELFDIIASLSLCTMYHVSVVLSEEMNLEDEIGKCWVFCYFFLLLVSSLLLPVRLCLRAQLPSASHCLMKIKSDQTCAKEKKNCKEEYNNEEK